MFLPLTLDGGRRMPLSASLSSDSRKHRGTSSSTAQYCITASRMSQMYASVGRKATAASTSSSISDGQAQAMGQQHTAANGSSASSSSESRDAAISFAANRDT